MNCWNKFSVLLGHISKLTATLKSVAEFKLYLNKVDSKNMAELFKHSMKSVIKSLSTTDVHL